MYRTCAEMRDNGRLTRRWATDRHD